MKWLPCEVEALTISLATRHFSPYIIQSSHSTCILTDSKPCVQAYEKLCRGEFSASPRVPTFLYTVSRYQASARHLAGTANVPSDFASRNAPECQEPRKCQICMFINREEECVVLRTQVSDIIEGKVRLPFTNRKTWLNIQGDCSDLRRTHAHLTQGTRPSKKITSVKDVKRYLNVATIARDGLLVVLRDHPIAASKECIIVPRQVLDGLLTAIHLQLHHPTRHQLKAVVSRYFSALDMATAIDRVTETCHQCLSLRKVPQIVVPQSSSCPPEAIGTSFAADVIKGNKQLIFVLCEVVTSFTASCLLQNEQHQSLRDALLQLCISLKPLDGPPAVVRVDPAPGFQSICDDELLGRHGIQIELGSAKNPNKNSVAEKAVQELEAELLCLNPLLNTRIRGGGLSSREMWTQRDQFTAQQLPMADQELIRNQHESRTSNHPYSQQSKAPHARTLPLVPIEVYTWWLTKTKPGIATAIWLSPQMAHGAPFLNSRGRSCVPLPTELKSAPVLRYRLIPSPPLPQPQGHWISRKISPQIPQTHHQIFPPFHRSCPPLMSLLVSLPPQMVLQVVSPFNLHLPPHPWSQSPRSPPLKHHLTWPPLPRLIRGYADLNAHDALPCTSLTMKSIIPDIKPSFSIFMDTWLLLVGSPTPCVVLLFVVCSFLLCSCRCNF